MIAKVASAVVAVCIAYSLGHWLGYRRYRKILSELKEKIERIKMLMESEEKE